MAGLKINSINKNRLGVLGGYREKRKIFVKVFVH